MKLLNVNLARSIWLCHLKDLNPTGLNLLVMAAPMLLDLYKFKTFPDHDGIVDESQGIKFDHGVFKISDDEVISIRCTIFNDGLVVDTGSSTQHTDAFLEDLLTNFQKNFNLPSFKNIIKKKQYVSQLYVSTGKSLELINPKFKEISSYLTENVYGHGNVSFEVGGISIFPDQINKINPIAFTLERQLDVPFADNRYFSAAPLQTEQHLKLLNKLEKTLG